MIYTINLSNYNPLYQTIAIKSFKLNATRRLRTFQFGTTEKLLDSYLRDQYQVSLKQACYLIICSCTVERSKDSVVIFLKDQTIDKLARLITFGTGKILGSQILTQILNKL